MKVQKLLLSLVLFFVVAVAHAQDAETRDMIASIKGQWKLDENGKVVCSKEIAFPGVSKEDIFYSAMYFLHQDYGNAGIQLQDLAAGKILVKGVFPRVHVAGGRSNQYHYNAMHEVQVEIKDELMVLNVMLKGYFMTSVTNPYYAQAAEVYASEDTASPNSFAITEFYPAGNHTELYHIEKNDTGLAFYESYQRALDTIFKLSGAFTASTYVDAE